MIIRPARADDAAAICAIWNPVIRDSLITFTTVEKTEAGVTADIAARGHAYLTAEENGSVCGFATYGAFRSGPGYAHTREHTVHVAPAARGRGVGRQLMTRLLDIAVGDGVHVMIAGISGAAPGSFAFHKALGFAECARIPQVGRKQGQWLDLILMQKILHLHPDTAGGEA